MQKAPIFPNIFRFLDELCLFNNNEFQNNYNDIYPNELKLKKKNDGHCKALFLDLSIEVHNKKFTTNLFDKIGTFFFYIDSIPYLKSNIKSKRFRINRLIMVRPH